jgi:hypothetical protein
VDVDPARVLTSVSGWNGSQGRASEEGHLDVVGEDVEPQELALALDAKEGRVPPHGIAHVRHVAHDERVEAAPDVAFPARMAAMYARTGASPSASSVWAAAGGTPRARLGTARTERHLVEGLSALGERRGVGRFPESLDRHRSLVRDLQTCLNRQRVWLYTALLRNPRALLGATSNTSATWPSQAPP